METATKTAEPTSGNAWPTNGEPLPIKLPFRCIVNADLFRRAMCCISKEPTRHYLQGVHIEPHKNGGALLVSTDSRRMIVIYDKDAFVEGGTAIIRPCSLIAKALAAKSTLPQFIAVSGATLVLANNPPVVRNPGDPKIKHKRDNKALLAMTTKPDRNVHAIQWCDVIIDGKFPAWRAVVPKQIVDGAQIGDFNAEYLRTLGGALGDVGSATKILASSKDEGHPHLVFGTNREVDGFGLIMPMRGGFAKSALPAWMMEPNLAVEPVAVVEDDTVAVTEAIKAAIAKCDITVEAVKALVKKRAKVATKKAPPPARKKPARKAAVAVRRAPKKAIKKPARRVARSK